MNNQKIVFKIIIVFLLLCVFEGRNVYSEEEDSKLIQIKYEFERPGITDTTIFQHSFKRVHMLGTRRLNREGKPCLPFQTARILLPYGYEVGDINVSIGDKIELEGSYSIEPGQKPVPFNQGEIIEYAPPSPEIYNSTNPYTKSYFSTAGTHLIRGYRVLIIRLFPVSYIPKLGTVVYYKELTVNVEAIVEKTPPKTFRGLSKDAELVRKNVDNPELLATYPLRQK